MKAEQLAREIDHAEAEAWNALARYKGSQFGYWFGIWVHLNRLEGRKRPNPWSGLVRAAREHLGRRVTRSKRNKSAPLPL